MSIACTLSSPHVSVAPLPPTMPMRHPPATSNGTARLQLFSDLHADVRPITPPVLAHGVDVVVVAGDTREGPAKGYELLRKLIPPPVPIIVVAGNHEHYRRCYIETIDEARSRASAFDITFLEDEVAIVAGIRFAGCTLWTDYCLTGELHQPIAMASARSGMNDHRLITWRKTPEWLRFRPQEALVAHQASRAFLERTLAEPFDGPTVVVSHHAPHPRSISAQFELDPLNPAFASDCSSLIVAGRPSLWLHGHTHTSADYWVGETRVVCNPHGYGRENPSFDPSCSLEVIR